MTGPQRVLFLDWPYPDRPAPEALTRPWRYPGLRERDAESLRLRISYDPGVSLRRSWSIFAEGERFWLRRVIWAHHWDAAALPPTTFASEVLLGARTAEAVLASATELVRTLRPAPRPGIVLDGMHASIQIARASVAWSSRHQDTERGDDWLAETRATLDALLPLSAAWGYP